MSDIKVEINRTEGENSFDLSIVMKGFNGNYYLALEHLLDLHLRERQKEGGMLAEQSDFQISNAPLFELKEMLLNEVRAKVNKGWKTGV